MSKKTPLHDIHVELGAWFTDFAGWAMPLRYTSELAEPTCRRAPRTGYAVLDPDTGQRIGEVTSGALSPTLGHPVAMAYLPTDWSEPGTKVLVDIRNSREYAEVVPLPFYRRPA